VTLWTKDTVPPAKHLDFGSIVPSPTLGLMWGILPMSTSIFAIFAVLLIPDRSRLGETLEFPSNTTSDVALGAK